MGKYRSLGTFLDRIFRNNLNSNFDDIDADIQAQKTRVDTIVASAGNSNTEIVDARGTFPVLGARLSSAETSLAEKAKQTDVDAALLLKRDKSAKITNTDVESTTDANKLKLANLAQEVINSMTGTTPVNNANPANSSVTLPTIATDTRDKINYGITARAKPLIWTGGSVTKTTTSFTLAGNVGLLVGKGVNLYITPVSFTGIQAGEVLVIRGLDLDTQADYLGTTNPKPTLLKVWHYQVTGSDIVVAWKDDKAVNSIYDGTDGVFYNKFYTLKASAWYGDANSSVSKTSSTITIAGSVGFTYNGKVLNVTPGTYTVNAVSFLVVRGYSYLSNGTITPISVLYDGILPDDFIIAYRDGRSLWTIWDNYINFNRYLNSRVKPWYSSSSDSVTKTSNSITLSGQIGLIYNNGQSLFINPATYTGLTAGYLLVIRGLDPSKTYDGTANPKFDLTKFFYNNLLPDDIVVAYADGSGIWTIWDEHILAITNTSVAKSTYETNLTVGINQSNLLPNSYPTVVKKMLAKTDNLNVLLTGNSIFATSGAWVQNVYDETKRFTSMLSTANAEPLGLTDNILSRKAYETLINQALNIPIYRRFDYGRTFDYNPASGTYGQDVSSAGAAFFTETGTFNTFINSNGNKGSDPKYNANVPMTKADFNLQSYDGASWYQSQAMEGFTRVSKDAGASVQFTVPVGYKKARVKLRYATDGDVLTTTLVNCNGAASIDTNYGPVTNNNNSAFKDIEFTITDTTQPATITLTKSSNTSKRIMYWGCYYYNEPTVLVTNYAYGGCSTGINKDVLPDALTATPVTPDLILWEVMLLNDFYNPVANSLQSISDYCDLLAGQNVIAIIPHQAKDYNLNPTVELWNKAKKVLMDKNIPFIDLSNVERTLVDYYGDYTTMIAALYKDNFVHPGNLGVSILKRPIQAVLRCNEYHKI
jgi:hypothetical protein